MFKPRKRRLSEEQVIAIRESEEKLGVLAARYKIAEMQISKIQRGLAYPDCGGPLRCARGKGRPGYRGPN